MKNVWKKFLLLTMCLLLAFEPSVAYAKQKNTVQVKVKAKEVYSYAFKELELMNKERKKKGKKALVMDRDLLEVAMQRAHECVLYWSHERPNGKTCFSAYKWDDAMSLGENIAVGQTSPKEVTDAWMNSQGHRENILNSSYQAVGIGCVKVNGELYWVQFFSSEVRQKAQKSSYKDITKTRTVEVKKQSPYYNASMSVDKTSLKIGESTKVHVFWRDMELKDSGVMIKSSDPAVCKVSKGKLIATGEGTANIKIYFSGYESKAVTKKITVKGGKVVKANKITLNRKTATVKVGKKLQLKATVAPKNSTQKSLQWTTSNKKVATVTKNGVVKGIKKGSVTITVKIKGTNKSAKCKITVKN